MSCYIDLSWYHELAAWFCDEPFRFLPVVSLVVVIIVFVLWNYNLFGYIQMTTTHVFVSFSLLSESKSLF